MTDKPSDQPAAAPAPKALASKPAAPAAKPKAPAPGVQQPRVKEAGGPSGPEPTRYGDWERKGRISDF
ncbi:MAG: DUF1674 domain-containing protein [Rhodospirillales bacterium]